MPVKAFEDGLFCNDGDEKKVSLRKSELSAYSNPRSGGIIGLTIDSDDELLSVRLTTGKDEVIFATSKGQSVRIFRRGC